MSPIRILAAAMVTAEPRGATRAGEPSWSALAQAHKSATISVLSMTDPSCD